jgi:hypothetical protein
MKAWSKETKSLLKSVFVNPISSNGIKITAKLIMILFFLISLSFLFYNSVAIVQPPRHKGYRIIENKF